MILNSETIIFTKALFDEESRKEIFDSLLFDDFLTQEAMECFTYMHSAFTTGTIFDEDFKQIVFQKYPHLIDPTKKMENVVHAIQEQKKKSLRIKLDKMFQKYHHVIMDPATSIEEMGYYCKTLYETSSSMAGTTKSPHSRIKGLDDTLNHLQDRASGKIQKLSFNMPNLNFELLKGDLVIVAGRPGSGKTSICLDFARRSALAGQASAFICLETDSKILRTRVISQQSGIEFLKIYNNLNEFTHADLTSFQLAVKTLKEIPLYIHSDYQQSIIDITRLCKFYKNKGVEVIYIDYLQKIAEDRRSRNRVEAVSKISSDLKNIALELDIVIVALAQLNRDSDNSHPRLSNLSGTSQIEKDASTVLIIDRPDSQSPPPQRNYKDNRGGNIDMRGLIALIDGKSRDFLGGVNYFNYDFSRFVLLDRWYPGTPRIMRGNE